jgi:hypothetical protein
MSMREFDEATITEAVLERVANTPNLRARQVGQALIRHLHAFIREIEPTEAEWEWGIRFLTETGQLCSDTRQEFILLSDTLGVSMLIDAINHRLPSGATETTVFGPFYTTPPEFASGADIRGHLQGRPMHVAGRVADPDGRPTAFTVYWIAASPIASSWPETTTASPTWQPIRGSCPGNASSRTSTTSTMFAAGSTASGNGQPRYAPMPRVNHTLRNLP